MRISDWSSDVCSSDLSVYVDFAVEQQVAAGLRKADKVKIFASSDTPTEAALVAIDARVDPATRNAVVRAKIADATRAPAPGHRKSVVEGQSVATRVSHGGRSVNKEQNNTLQRK